MDLGVVGAGAGVGAGAAGDGAVTLLSYARPNAAGASGRSRLFQKGANSSLSSSSSSSSVAKVFKTLRRRSKSASRLKDRQQQQQQQQQQQLRPDLHGSDCSLNQLALDPAPGGDPVRPITYSRNGERLCRDPDAVVAANRTERVTLIGFVSSVERSSGDNGSSSNCSCGIVNNTTTNNNNGRFDKSRQVSGRNRLRRRSNYDFGGSAHNLAYYNGGSSSNSNNNNNNNRSIGGIDGNGNSSSNGNFATLKTSREVKMERERLRQERMREQQRRKGMLLSPSSPSLLSQPPSSTSSVSSATATATRLTMLDSLLAEERARFFEEAREEFSRRNLASSELFSQFVRENQERFQQLVQHRRCGVCVLLFLPR